MRSRILVIVAVAAALAFAPAPLPRQERRGGDQADVAGTWEFVACESNGQPYLITPRNYLVEMNRERFTFVQKSGGNGASYAMRLDPTASPPSFTWSQN